MFVKNLKLVSRTVGCLLAAATSIATATPIHNHTGLSGTFSVQDFNSPVLGPDVAAGATFAPATFTNMFTTGDYAGTYTNLTIQSLANATTFAPTGLPAHLDFTSPLSAVAFAIGSSAVAGTPPSAPTAPVEPNRDDYFYLAGGAFDQVSFDEDYAQYLSDLATYPAALAAYNGAYVAYLDATLGGLQVTLTPYLG